MNKSLEQTIVEELHKTGYPVEIISASVMQQRGWAIVHNPSYLDEDENDSREFDIRAYRPVAAGKITVGYYLITECKKSEKPWVFFTTPETHYAYRLGSLIRGHIAGRQIFADHQASNSVITDDDLRGFHHYFQNRKLARTFYEPLKGQEKTSHSQMIYSAVMSTIKATLFHWNDGPLQEFFHVFYPLIVFSGDLFEAQVNANRDIDLQRSDHVQLSFYYIFRSQSPQRPARDSLYRFMIDVVRDSYLDQFLKVLEDEQETLAAHLRASLGS